ncbi:hypothetical protein [Deinococcus sp. Leaf326]|uniref:hypothetical protein n=1 Tax=Deinococcus sp. Leaf326 TaxID=1736338 RepID=UPI0007158583|nr:hypothetical protein [Deinococcus sp. Leaf326]KQR40796.1 hypothetical protein ASF71_01105 [Deinococcus sp. Leaf326]
MSSERRVTRQRRTERPAVVNDAVTRGQMARHLLDAIPILATDFSEVTGIPLATLKAYLRGTVDIANMKRSNAHKFISGLGLSDAELQELFGIPEELRGEWRSDRPPPLGSGPAILSLDEVEQLVLPAPIFGEMSLPAGISVVYRPGGTGMYYLMRLSSGQLLAVRDPVVSPGVEVLGSLLSAHFELPPPRSAELAIRPRY